MLHRKGAIRIHTDPTVHNRYGKSDQGQLTYSGIPHNGCISGGADICISRALDARHSFSEAQGWTLDIGGIVDYIISVTNVDFPNPDRQVSHLFLYDISRH